MDFEKEFPVFLTNVACKTRYYNWLLFVIEFTNKHLLDIHTVPVVVCVDAAVDNGHSLFSMYLENSNTIREQ